MKVVYDDVFRLFYVPLSVPLPELTKEELDAIDEAADLFYQNLACG